MVSVCFYFQVHQPFRLRKYSVFDVGQNHQYFDEQRNEKEMRKIAGKCYMQANSVMLELIRKHPEFKIAYSISGTAIEQMRLYAPDALESFRKLASTGKVEFLNETYYHSLSCIYSKDEFRRQIEMHKKLIEQEFGQTPEVFRNTELVFNNEIANTIMKMGFKAILAEGVDRILQWRSPNFPYTVVTAPNIKVLMKNYRLSDDVAFRFSERSWSEWPLTAPKFAQWVNAINGNGNVVNLFMDYETFGEHQWDTTGIFDFLRALPAEILKNSDNDFVTPGEAADRYRAVAELDVHNIVSWADIERDLSAWLGNKMQRAAIEQLYALEPEILKSGDQKLADDWRKLQTSDHFYYMCTKWFADGDVHKYFNPYESPYEGFIWFMNVINDIKLRLKEKKKVIA
ncbi:MAG: alpha-amylase [Nanoarchaeota archaeon]|nr:MAG: alpha-amylase [Nanoarchaeota archaeon]